MRKIILALLTVVVLLGSLATLQPNASANEAETSTASSTSFKDVSSNHWARNAITAAVDDGIINGYTDKTFRPNNQVKENEFYAMLLRSFDKSLSNGTSKNGGNWADPYYDFAAEMNYPTHTKRTQVLNRTRVAEIIVGIQGYNFSGDDAIQFLIATGLSSGKTSDTIKGYAGNDRLTRAEAVVFIASVKKHLGSDFQLKARPKTPSSKLDLPQIGLRGENVVGKRDAALEAEAIKVNQVASKYEMYAGYNSSQGVIFAKSSDGYVTMVYNDQTDEAGGTVSIVLEQMMKNHKVQEDRVEAVVESMKALGIKVDSKLTAAIKTVLLDSNAVETVKYNGFNVEVMNVKYGSVLIYLD